MKKKVMYYLAMAMIAISCMTTVNKAQTRITGQFQYDSTGKTYQLQANQDLVVMVNNVRKYDVLSIEPNTSTNSKSVTLKASEIAYKIDAATTRSTSAIQSIDALADTNISFNGGVLVINGSGGNKRCVIHLGIPSGFRTKIIVNGVEYHNGSLSSPIMVQNGRLNNPNASNSNAAINLKGFNPNVGYSPEISLLSAISPTVASKTDLSNVFKRIDSNTLSNLASKKVATPLMQDKGQNWAMVNVEVNEAGQVTSVSYVAGDTRLADFSSTTLKQFKFQPFMLNGKAIKVASLVPITSLDGQVTLFGKIKQ